MKDAIALADDSIDAPPQAGRNFLERTRTTLRTHRQSRLGLSFHLGIGGDNLLHTDRTNLRVRFSVANLTNRVDSTVLLNIQRDVLPYAARVPAGSRV